MFKIYRSKRITLTCGKLLKNFREYASTKSPLQAQHTALYDFHTKHGGKMVNFGGYILPVQYSDQSIIASHLHTRQHAAIFDVSHMLQTYVRGSDAIACIESLCTADIKGMAVGQSTLTVFTNENGGILDDLIVTKISDEQLYIVSNAAMKSQDMQIMMCAKDHFTADGKKVDIEFLSTSDQSLIAVQGPKAVANLQKLLPKTKTLDEFYFLHTTVSEVAGIQDCRITRCGYTGEDGVEVSVPSAHVVHVTEALLNANEYLKLAGLGARDTLRLEAGLCLYGSDINAETTPVEAGLAWLIARRRRNESNFPGAKRILSQLDKQTDEIKLRRIGLTMCEDKKSPPARAGSKIYHKDKEVGYITSGCISPSLGKNISMGYIAAAHARTPHEMVQLKIRDNFYDAFITRMPFVKTNYFNKPKNSV
ncbi:aminomethyltransferase, mitochondrial [Zeugodacus cucurbitae]|uniref:Aminomethyltransferase n=1 Tax=Zeugodacus cucurbitae TaxID=28588 RepID=A0A0A1XT44_ZEUCU|nr:aminomethyltransferase, mitochondrial [Zeugodacus cucurbitae]XP_054091422.1 aminomethyltransferase, mitochondrial [Zeugodacus cucurbitae]